MLHEILKSDNRGQVGIGTLIVFIAMVLVAAIAAGVLVNTAGQLQGKAAQTGDEAQNMVTNRVEVISTYGVINHIEPDDGGDDAANGEFYLDDGSDANGDSGASDSVYAIDELNFVMMRSAGADNIQLKSVVLMWQGPEGAEQITLDETKTDSPITITDISGADDGVLNENSDRAKVTLALDPLYDSSASDNKKTSFDVLTAGQKATIKFTTVSGATVTKTVNVPTTYPSDDGAVISL